MANTVIVDLAGYTITAQEQQLLLHPEVAGVLLFTRNIKNRQQLQQLTTAIHQLRSELFISIDHEGGFVQRIQRLGFRALPSARVLGEIYDTNPETGLAMATRYGKQMADDLIACGIDVSFAPVLDLHNDASPIIGGLDRAFHTDPHIISTLAAAYIQGMHQAGMPAIGKHFPGHGSCFSDSHLALPINDKSMDELTASDLKPFIALIKAQQLDAVMPAHVVYTAVDAHFAAGYSTLWLQQILRSQLQFKGLVVSDCLGMKGADIGDLNTRAQQALTAGCDLLIACNQPQHELLNFLSTQISNPASALRLEHFKNSMRRFNHPSALFQAITEPSINIDFDPRNPTQSI
jgi:beta-N-acetylhexosaminidase